MKIQQIEMLPLNKLQYKTRRKSNSKFQKIDFQSKLFSIKASSTVGNLSDTNVKFSHVSFQDASGTIETLRGMFFPFGCILMRST